jgi:hypothetical protein
MWIYFPRNTFLCSGITSFFGKLSQDDEIKPEEPSRVEMQEKAEKKK